MRYVDISGGIQMDKELTNEEKIREREKWINKYFDVAENPIKIWIAKYLSVDVNSLYSDFAGDSDILSVMDNNHTYEISLSSDENNRNCENTIMPKNEELKLMPNLAKGLSVIFDAVNTVFSPVVKTCHENYKNIFHDMVAKFDQEKMVFELFKINGKAQEKDEYGKILYNIFENKEKIKKSGKNNKELEEIMDKLLNLEKETLIKYNSISYYELDEVEKECRKENEKLKTAPKLYIIIKMDSKNLNAISKRLPEIGHKYSDPNDPDALDMLKKELE